MKRHGLPNRVRNARTQEGFTILELTMAMFVFAVIMASVAAALATTLNATRNNGNRVIAANIAAEDVDDLRLQASDDFSTITDQLGQTSSTRAVGGVAYTVTRNLQWINGGAGSTPCDGSSTAGVAYVRVTSKVSWPEMGAVNPPQSQTVITPPVGVYKPDKGNVGVKITGGDDTPRAGVLVTLTGPSVSETQTTGSDGCVFFPFLDPNGYTVQISKSGYADLQGVTSPSSAAGVNVGSTTQLSFNYDELGQIEVEQRPLFDAAGPTYSGHLPLNAPLTLFNTVFQPIDTKSFPGTGTVRLFASLYPHPAGYPVWAGSCTDADPDLYKASPDDPTLRPAALAVEPGMKTPGFVDLPAVRVQVRELYSGDDESDLVLRLVHAPAPGCPSGETLDYSSSAKTDSDGRVVIAAPFGAWKIQVVGRTTSPASGKDLVLRPDDIQPRAEVDVKVLP